MPQKDTAAEALIKKVLEDASEMKRPTTAPYKTWAEKLAADRKEIANHLPPK